MKLSMIVVITSCAPHFARSESHGAAGAHRGDRAQRHRNERRRARRKRESHQRCPEPARRELPLGADVEQTGAESHRHSEAGADERRCLVEHLAEAIRIAPRALEHQPVHGTRRLPHREYEQIARDDRDEQRDERRQHGFE
jgi:hypothetical protein